jgi:serine/threonine protein kinase
MVYPAVPSIEDIISSQSVLSAPDASSRVVRVDEIFAVKFGGTTSSTEAATLEYLSEQSDIPVPKFYTSFSDPRTDTYFIVMQYIEGITLEEALPTLTTKEKVDLVMQIREILQDLRSLKSPDYLGSVNHLPYEDGVFYDTETLHPISNGLRELSLHHSFSLYATSLRGCLVMKQSSRTGICNQRTSYFKRRRRVMERESTK